MAIAVEFRTFKPITQGKISFYGSKQHRKSMLRRCWRSMIFLKIYPEKCILAALNSAVSSSGVVIKRLVGLVRRKSLQPRRPPVTQFTRHS